MMKAVLLCVIVQQAGQGGGSTSQRYLLLYMRHTRDFYLNSNLADLSAAAVGLSDAGPIVASTLGIIGILATVSPWVAYF